MALTPPQLQYLRDLKPRAYRRGSALAFTAPTWAMRANLTLEHFLPDLEHPTKAAVAWRDFANKPTAGLRPFFANPEVLLNLAQDDTIDPVPSVRWDPLAHAFQIHPRLTPRPGRAYAFAGDLSVSGDSTGLALVHLEPDGSADIDFSLRIHAAPRVDYGPIEDLILHLRDELGFVFIGVFFDQFQSHRTIGRLLDAGLTAKVVRFADSHAGCSTVSDMLHAGLLRYHRERDKDFLGEAVELQDINGKRVDHLTSGGVYNSKDVWDAVVNALVSALEADKGAGLRLTPEDLHLYDRPALLADYERLRVEAARAGAPAPQVYQVAHIHANLASATDTLTATLAHVARDLDFPRVYLLGAARHRLPPQALAATLAAQFESWHLLPFRSPQPPQPAEITVNTDADADALADAFKATLPDLLLSTLPSNFSDPAQVELTKELVRSGTLRIPADYKDDPALRRLVAQLLSHPYVPDAYDLLALAGAVANAQELEVVPAPAPGAGSAGLTPLKNW
jgi:hypothetical protein